MISKKLEGNKYCPVKCTKNYIKVRPKIRQKDEQFFIFRDRSNLKPDQLRKIVRKTIWNMNLNASHYDIHSFRIGRATDFEKNNSQIDRIKQLGRWKSNAVYRYLRKHLTINYLPEYTVHYNKQTFHTRSRHKIYHACH